MMNEKINGIEVGNIFYASYGYDVSLIDFYQVVALEENRNVVELRKLCTKNMIKDPELEDGFVGLLEPIPNKYLDNATIKKAFKILHNDVVIIPGMVGSAIGYIYDGKPKYVWGRETK